ncbi:MAG TPA: hypothetical protein VFX74_03600, partial [Candidatus Limnocylindria bacterium]|nr:hypothetical protein [Candidatus Limnocylindria bacterium]
EAAVMPLPSELVTPPVTKTYFGIGLVIPPGFFRFYHRPSCAACPLAYEEAMPVASHAAGAHEEET